MSAASRKLQLGPFVLACMFALASNSAGHAESNKVVGDFLSGKSNTLTGVDCGPRWSDSVKMTDDGPVVHSYRQAPMNDPGFVIPVGPEFPRAVRSIRIRRPDKGPEIDSTTTVVGRKDDVPARAPAPNSSENVIKKSPDKPLPQSGFGPCKHENKPADQFIQKDKIPPDSQGAKTTDQSQKRSDQPLD